MAVTLVWLRNDLRLDDNPALRSAVDSGDHVVVCYVLDGVSNGIRPLGGAARWWLHHSLAALSDAIADRGIRLVLRSGPVARVLKDLAREVGAGTMVWNRRYGAPERAIDAELKAWCGSVHVSAHSFQANLMFEPWEITTGAGEPYKVFTPFWRACMRRAAPRAPFDPPAAISGPDVSSEKLADWQLLPTRPDWSAGLQETWTPGESGASERLHVFLECSAAGYALQRDRPGVEGTSKLSPHLRFGEISPFRVWHAAQASGKPSLAEDLRVFGTELGWREFCTQLLFHNPDLASVNYRREFDNFAWEDPTPAELRAWQQGTTGYPLVDAGMRQLWQTGWMHNRVRMIAASFLIKNMMVDWRVGEQWFWDTLVDADGASNPANWQWVAGSGADASPYFRIFNPVTQSKKFDGDGRYLLRYVPELADADNIHEPWTSPQLDYAPPLVDLAESRQRALAAYQNLGG